MTDNPIKVRALDFIERHPKTRAAKVLKAILERGSITTEEIRDLGYDHPPRARMDVVDEGFVVKKTMVTGVGGKRMARYSLDFCVDADAGKSGRSPIPKAFKKKLIARYGECDHITGWQVTARALQVDHRIPYQIGGDEGLDAQDVGAFMLLTGRTQRAKSFSCENCPNFVETRDPAICAACYWAFPEAYDHIATRKVREIRLVWNDRDVEAFDRIEAKLKAQGRTVEEAIKTLLLGLDE